MMNLKERIDLRERTKERVKELRVARNKVTANSFKWMLLTRTLELNIWLYTKAMGYPSKDLM